MKLTHLLWGLVALIVVSLINAACGSGGESPTPRPLAPNNTPVATATSAPVPTATRSPVPTTTSTAVPPTAPSPALTPTAVVRPTPTPVVVTPPLAAQVDKNTLWQHFKDIVLGKLALGVQPGPGSCPSSTNAFTARDQFCVTYSIIKQPEQVFDAVYDTRAQTYARPRAALAPFSGTGDQIVCAPFTLPPGSYSYRMWVGDVLVADVPFNAR